MNGPRLEIVATCADCRWLRREQATGEYDKHVATYDRYKCAHRFYDNFVGDDLKTPSNCALLLDARAKFISDLKGGSDA